MFLCRGLIFNFCFQVNGRNTALVVAVEKAIPLVSDLPTIIFGADVTHPAPGDDSSPSIAAVSITSSLIEIQYSQNLIFFSYFDFILGRGVRGLAKYHRLPLSALCPDPRARDDQGLVRTSCRRHDQVIAELYFTLSLSRLNVYLQRASEDVQAEARREGTTHYFLQVYSVLTSFFTILNQIFDYSPEPLLALTPFSRDGVSEGQFNEVLLYEMLAIRQVDYSGSSGLVNSLG